MIEMIETRVNDEVNLLEGLNELLLNIFIIILSILIYFSIRIQPKYTKLIFVLLSTIALILCMTFPFSFLAGYKYDLRTIPLVLAILYGGYGMGAMVTVAMFAYRYYLGGPGFLLTLYTFPLIIILAFCLYSRFHTSERIYKMLMASGLAFLWAFICSLVSFSGPIEMLFSAENVAFYFGFCLLHALTMWIGVYLIENLRENDLMRREIQRTETMNALSELAATVAHEIRNPLTVVRGFMQLLNERQTDETDRKYMKMMIDELDSAESIINNFLSLSKPQREEITRINAAEQIHHVAKVTSSFATIQNVEIQMKVEESLYIHANRVKLGQVLLNLIKNGIEAMPKGGTLQIIGFKNGDYVIIDLIDTGVGMELHEIQQLGNPFYSTKKKGTGLGLLTSYRIIQMMNGKIRVTSRKGKGTHFSISLPLAIEE